MKQLVPTSRQMLVVSLQIIGSVIMGIAIADLKKNRSSGLVVQSKFENRGRRKRDSPIVWYGVKLDLHCVLFASTSTSTGQSEKVPSSKRRPGVWLTRVPTRASLERLVLAEGGLEHE